MAQLAYFRVSTLGQSIESQRTAMKGPYEREFSDVGVSGGILARERSGFAELLRFVRSGDTVHVYSVDRLGRDALDVQGTVRTLLRKGVKLEVNGLGAIEGQTGELILAVLAQVADMERNRILEKTEAGRATAREALASTGRTHKGKLSLGRPLGRLAGGITVDPKVVVKWRTKEKASIKETAEHWKVSTASVKRWQRADE
jgi:putative DNA-invertase from lambdoid prophage Rac